MHNNKPRRFSGVGFLLSGVRYGKGGVAFSKYSMLVLLAVAFLALLWRFGRVAFTGITKWLLWALAAVCAGTGLAFIVTSEGKPLPIAGGLVLWAFAAYAIKVAESSHKRG